MMSKNCVMFFFVIILLYFTLLIWCDDRGEIYSGETRIGLQIQAPSYLDSWTFQGNTDDRVIINAVATSGSLDTYIDLYSPPPDSSKVATTEPWGDQLDYQLQQTGLFTILVQDHWLDHSGGYNISLTKIPSTIRPGIYNPNPANGSTINYIVGNLSWDAVSGATGYDLYFGKDVTEPLVEIGNNLLTPSMAFSSLQRGNIYYWYVIAHTPSGDIYGPYWWFNVTYLDVEKWMIFE